MFLSVKMIDELVNCYTDKLLKKHDKNLFFSNCEFPNIDYICTKKKFSNGKPN